MSNEVHHVSEPVAVEALKEKTEQVAHGVPVSNMEMAPIMEQLNAALLGAMGELGQRLQASQAEDRARLYERWAQEDAWKREQEAALKAMQEKVNELIHSTPEPAKAEAEAKLLARARLAADEKANNPKDLHQRLMTQVFERIYVNDPQLARQGIHLNGTYHWRLDLGWNDVPKDIADNYRALLRNRDLLNALHGMCTTSGTGDGLGTKFQRNPRVEFNHMMKNLLEQHSVRPDNPSATTDVLTATPIYRQV